MSGTFDAAFLDDTPLPTKFRPPNLRCAYRAIDSVRRVNFQSGMRSYVAEQNLKTLSAKSSRTNVSSNCGIICDSFPSSTSSSQISVSSYPQSGQRLTVRSLPASRAVSSCDLLQQVRFRTHSNENLAHEKKALEQQLFELQKKLNVLLKAPFGNFLNHPLRRKWMIPIIMNQRTKYNSNSRRLIQSTCSNFSLSEFQQVVKTHCKLHNPSKAYDTRHTAVEGKQ
ncbi:unnamed protein product [Allacma fusca]|uniref:Uncharacterized protein n=1 Tax=Allacma fusca TaxID=39272 RepID=A0A8J2K365_9HEXA|nr:unnamed protein product [Allacma fusca]